MSAISGLRAVTRLVLAFSAAICAVALTLPAAPTRLAAQGSGLHESSVVGLAARVGAGGVVGAPSEPDLLSKWTPAAVYPSTIVRYAFVQVGADSYVIGGVSDGTRVPNVRRYNAVTNAWTDRAPIPVASEAPAAAYYNGKIYVVEGDTGNSLQIYDIAGNSWSAGAPRPGFGSGYGAAAGAFNGSVFVIGGDAAPQTTLSIYNIAANSWSTGTAAPAGVFLAGYNTVGQYLYIVGGFGADASSNSTVTRRLDMAAGTWSTGPTFTPARADFGLASSGSRLFAIGGDTNATGYFNSTAQVDELDTSTWPAGNWATSPALPSIRQGNQAGFFTTGRIGGETWSTGGIDGSTFTFRNEHLYEAVPASCKTWSIATSYPINVLDNGATTVDGTLYSFGGVSNGVITAASYKFDGTTWTSIAPITAPLEKPGVATDGTFAYLVEGNTTGNVIVNTLYRYNPGSNSYATLAAATTAVWNPAVVYLNGKLYKIGGYTGPSGGTETNVVEIYDIASNTWSTAAPYPVAMAWISAFTLNGFVYGAGGFGGAPTAKTYRYDPATNTWDDASIADLPETRWGAATTIYHGSGALVGGATPGGATATETAVRWDPATNAWSVLPSMFQPRVRVTGAVLAGSFHVIGGRSLAGGFIGTTENQRFACVNRVVGDFDGDSKSDRTVFRPSNNVWYSVLSSGGSIATGWGASGDIDVPGDYDGDGKADVAIFRPSNGTWFIVQSTTGTVRATLWGTTADIPLAGDVDGDGKDDLVIYRPSAGAWFLYKSGGGTSVLGWGLSGDFPLLGDFDGDGKADVVAYRPSSGVWYVLLAIGGTSITGWGTPGDIPVSGDFDGDLITDKAVFRPSSGAWLVNQSGGGVKVVTWGVSGDVPIAGDLDGDGRADFTIFRDGSGVWFTQFATGATASAGWGIPGDKAIGRRPGS